MIVDYASDLHFNHWMRWIPNQLKWENRTRALTRRLLEDGHGEVLVLAGDFGEWNCQAYWIIHEASKLYERVYYTYGNHDLYLLTKRQRRRYNDSMGRLNDLVELTSTIPNVVPLIKTVDIFKGKTFAGDVMWYLPKTEEDWSFFKGSSNDSEMIHLNGYTQEDMMRKMWKDSMDWYDALENEDIDVFVSHVPPVHNPYSIFEPNYCYMVDVPFLCAPHWICGHDHMQKDFFKAGTHFHMNAIGYAHHYEGDVINRVPDKEVDTYKSFDIKSFEI